MIFLELATNKAQGSVLGHSIKKDSVQLKKGHLLTGDDVESLTRHGIEMVFAATLEEDDVREDEAAGQIAKALGGSFVNIQKPFTGRSNLYAKTDGVLVFDQSTIHAVNKITEDITIATLMPYAAVSKGQMVATVKIIPFAAKMPDANKARALISEGGGLSIAPFNTKNAVLIQTETSAVTTKTLDKTFRITKERLEVSKIELCSEKRCAHKTRDLKASIIEALEAKPDLLLIAGASAIADRADVLPQAIIDAGGRIEHFGMPVDPGNLLLFAHLGSIPVIGLPGCARSPKLNGFDWVLQRISADLPVSRDIIQEMGVGGLLMEIPTRPQPREKQRTRKTAKLAAVVLAAGQSRRMGKVNKLLLEVEGKPLLLHTIEHLLACPFEKILVVTGHEREKVEELLRGLPLEFAHNPDYAQGLSTSLRAGLAGLAKEVDGALITLGDMPLVDQGLIKNLIEHFSRQKMPCIIVPTHQHKRGNPILWHHSFFDEMRKIEGDVGARHLLGVHGQNVVEVEIASDAPLIDLDTPQAVASYLKKV